MYATRNIVTRLEFGKVRGGIRLGAGYLHATLICESQFGGEGNFVHTNSIDTRRPTMAAAR